MRKPDPEAIGTVSLLRHAMALDLYQLRRYRLGNALAALVLLSFLIFEGAMSLRNGNPQSTSRLLLTIALSLAGAHGFRSFSAAESSFLLTKPVHPQSLPWYWLYQCLKPALWLGSGLAIPLLSRTLEWKVIPGVLLLAVVGSGLGVQLAIAAREVQLKRRGSLLLLAIFGALSGLLLFDISKKFAGAILGDTGALLRTGLSAGVTLLLLPWMFTRALRGTPELIGQTGVTVRRTTTTLHSLSQSGWKVFVELEVLRLRRFPWLLVTPVFGGLGALTLSVTADPGGANAKAFVALAVLAVSGTAFAFPGILTRQASELRFFAGLPGALTSLLNARLLVTIFVTAPWALLVLAVGGPRNWGSALIASAGLLFLVPTSAAIGSLSALLIVSLDTTQLGVLAARVVSFYGWLIYIAAALVGIGAVTQYGIWAGLPATALFSVLLGLLADALMERTSRRKEWGA